MDDYHRQLFLHKEDLLLQNAIIIEISGQLLHIEMRLMLEPYSEMCKIHV